MSLVRPVHPIRPGSGITLSFAILFLLGAANAFASGINLSWNDCGEHGDAIDKFACTTNSGPVFTLYASFVPPDGIDHFVGMSASVRLAASSYPDWWKIGTCRSNGALAVGFDEPGACLSPWGGGSGGGSLFTIGGYGSNTGRLLVQAANPEPMSLETAEYTAFRIRITRALSTGSGACGGCLTPLEFTLNDIQLFQPGQYGNDPVLTMPLLRNHAWWQSAVGGTPTIASFSPAGGAAGTLVTVHGSDLNAASILRFGGKAAIASPVSSSTVRAFVPIGAPAGPLTVETPFGTGTSAQPFIPAPTLDYPMPPSAPAGTKVDLHGRGLTGATQVSFGGVPASFDVVSDARIATVVPAAAGTGLITVSNLGGSDDVGPFRVEETRGGINLSWDDCANQGSSVKAWECSNETRQFPLVASFVAPAGVTEAQWIEGEILVSGAYIPDWWRFNPGSCRDGSGLRVDSNFGSPQTCEVPSLWSGGTGYQYQVGYEGSLKTALIRMSAVFANGGVTLFPDREYSVFRVLIGRERFEDDCAGCQMPMKLELRNIKIHQSAALNFDPVLSDPIFRTVAYWQGAPGAATVVSGFIPPGGPIGTLVTLNGSGFANATAVRFAGSEAPFNVVSDARIIALVPQVAPLAPPASLEVVSPQGAGISSASFFLPPDVLQVVPPIGMEGDAITITGAGLSGTTEVTFNGLAASFRVEDDRKLVAIVPEGAKSGPLAVTNPGGTTVFADNFQVVDDTTPTLVSLARSEILADRVRLAWDIPRGGSATLYRREGMEPWSERARLTPNAEGRLEFEDAEVKPAAMYGYRLGLLIGRREIFGGDVTITMPSGISAAIELRNVEWSRGRLRATLSLPAAGAATLEVFDLSGRRTLERRIEAAEAGEQSAEWAAPGMASGMYFARLTQERGGVTRRFIVAQ